MSFATEIWVHPIFFFVNRKKSNQVNNFFQKLTIYSSQAPTKQSNASSDVEVEEKETSVSKEDTDHEEKASNEVCFISFSSLRRNEENVFMDSSYIEYTAGEGQAWGCLEYTACELYSYGNKEIIK